MEFVTEWIAIGNWRDARNIKALKESNIEAVLCVANWVRVPRKKYQEAGIISRKFSIEDSTPLPRKKEKEFFAAFVAAWLHTRMDMEWEDAIAHIKRARPIVWPQREPFASMKELIRKRYNASSK